MSNQAVHVPRSEHGFTLVEILVSMLVVAVGVLAVLGVQSRTLVDTQTAVRRAQAIRLIEDLSDRMQSNPSALTNIDHYTFAFPADPNVNLCPDDGSDDDDNSYTSETLAEHDRDAWKEAVACTLPNGLAAVFKVSAEVDPVLDPRQLGVMVAWRENEREGDSADETAQLRAPFQVENGDEVACPENHICHLQYVQLTSRCTPDELAGSVFYCADGLYLIN